MLKRPQCDTTGGALDGTASRAPLACASHAPFRRRLLTRSTGLALLACIAPATLMNPATAAEAVSPLFKAARLRMLTQRVSKAALQTAVGVRPEQAKQVLDRTAQEGAQLIADLKIRPGGADVARHLSAFETQWARFMTVASVPADARTALVVMAQGDEIFETGNQLVAAYEATYKGGYAKLLNLCGRQRGLALRMAINFFAGQITKEARYARAVNNNRDSFVAALDTLTNAPISTPQIRNDLQLAQGQWVFLDQALKNASRPSASTDVATATERLVDVFEDMVYSYDQALGSLQ